MIEYSVFLSEGDLVGAVAEGLGRSIGCCKNPLQAMESFEAMPPMWNVQKNWRTNFHGVADTEHLAMLIKSSDTAASQLADLVKQWDEKQLNASEILQKELSMLRRQKVLAESHRQETLVKASKHARSVEDWKETTEKLSQLLLDSMNREKHLLEKVHEMTNAQSPMKELQQELEREDNFLHFVFRNSPVAIAHQDKDLRYRFVNNPYPGFEDIIGKTTEELFHGVGMEESTAIKMAVLREKRSILREMTYCYSPDPSFGPKTFLLSIEPVFNKINEVLGLNMVGMDVTDQIAKREKLTLLREQAAVQRGIEAELHKTLGITEETIRAKQLLATVSHEIRSPLSGVMSMADILANTKLEKEQQKLVSIMLSSGEVVLQLLNDILDLSKYESGVLKLEPISFRPRELVKSVLQTVGASAHKKHLALEGFVSAEVPHEIVGDSRRIMQVLINLVSNAIKFTHEGAVRVTITASNEPKQGKCMPVGPSKEMSEPPSNFHSTALWLSCEVSDTGIGIPETALPFLFKKYMQISATHPREYGGTGLGLAICKELVDLMGGTLKVSSKVSEGSKFSFVLRFEATQNRQPSSEAGCFKFSPCELFRPVANANTSSSPIGTPSSHEKSPVAVKLKKAKILLVEDSKVNITVMKTMLKCLGAESEVVTNGEEAVEAVKCRKYDLILMDIFLPVMDGLEATRLIREYEQACNEKIVGGESAAVNLRRIPIIAMTANVMADNAASCYAQGMDCFITKPIVLSRLKEVLLELLPEP